MAKRLRCKASSTWCTTWIESITRLAVRQCFGTMWILTSRTIWPARRMQMNSPYVFVVNLLRIKIDKNSKQISILWFFFSHSSFHMHFPNVPPIDIAMTVLITVKYLFCEFNLWVSSIHHRKEWYVGILGTHLWKYLSHALHLVV